MMAGAGIIPPPFARADQLGLDEVLAELERAERGMGRALRAADDPAPARRPGPARASRAGQGFFPYPQPDAGLGGRARSSSRRASEIAIAWLDRPPANSISPEVVERAAAACGTTVDAAPARTGAGLRLGQPDAVLRRRRHQVVHDDGRGRRPATCSTRCTRCCATMETSRDRDDRRGQRARVRRRVRAGDGVRLPDRRRVGDASASPRSTSGSSPASAAPSGCRGWSARRRRWR